MATAALLAAIVGLLLYQVLTGAITRAIAAEVAGQDLDVEQSYRFGFARTPGPRHPQGKPTGISRVTLKR